MELVASAMLQVESEVGDDPEDSIMATHVEAGKQSDALGHSDIVSVCVHLADGSGQSDPTPGRMAKEPSGAGHA